MKNSLRIDLSNPAEVAAEMPKLRRLYEEKIRERNVLDEQIELLRRLVGGATDVIRATAQGRNEEQAPPPRTQRRRAAPAQDRAVLGLKAAAAGGFAVTPTSLYKFMITNGMDAPKDANVLGANLWDAWKAGRIMKAPNGVYTPLDGTGRTEWDRPLTDYYYAAELGLPIPS
jgi:hypothetical protein